MSIPAMIALFLGCVSGIAVWRVGEAIHDGKGKKYTALIRRGFVRSTPHLQYPRVSGTLCALIGGVVAVGIEGQANVVPVFPLALLILWPNSVAMALYAVQVVKDLHRTERNWPVVFFALTTTSSFVAVIFVLLLPELQIWLLLLPLIPVVFFQVFDTEAQRRINPVMSVTISEAMIAYLPIGALTLSATCIILYVVQL